MAATTTMSSALPMTEYEIPGQENQGEGNSLFYASTNAQLREETEYIRKIRTTLEKIRKEMFGDGVGCEVTNIERWKLDPKKPHTLQDLNNHDKHMNGCYSKHQQVLQKLKTKDLQLIKIQKENQELAIKMEATQEAGAAAIRDATRRLYETYQKEAEELNSKHQQEQQKLQVCAVNQEQILTHSIESYHEVVARLHEKESKVTQMESLVERMQREKEELIERKQTIEKEILWRASNSRNTSGNYECNSLIKEASSLQEKIRHLQSIILNQHRGLHILIQQIGELTDELKKQDEVIKSLKERLSSLEAMNKELKHNVEFWSSQQKQKISKPVSFKSYSNNGKNPYLTLMKISAQNG
ncbi:coiled-coil domain-containing protein 68 isoform X2 [Latimeria chalumnae]|uniref:coiled-coil domain-containing protein 68 isoform X2 n=1 Tax=Latimeria chalumnae TaxID=7897 RepID=UPI00313F37DF